MTQHTPMLALHTEKKMDKAVSWERVGSGIAHMLTLGVAIGSLAYSYGISTTNIQHLENGRQEIDRSIQQLQSNDASINAALVDLRVAIATLTQQVVQLRAENDQRRRQGG